MFNRGVETHILLERIKELETAKEHLTHILWAAAKHHGGLTVPSELMINDRGTIYTEKAIETDALKIWAK